jgi:transposase-like protein
MVIVPVGSLFLQVERERSEQAFKERLIAEITEQMQQVLVRCLEAVLELEVTELLGREWYGRRRDQERCWIEARCGKCGSQDRRQFSRNGHYKRKLSTRWGRVEINVPQIECTCGGMVNMPFQTLRRRQRIWDDLEGEIREEYGWGKSLRWLKACMDAKLGGSVGLRTLNQRMHELARLVPEWREEKLKDVPPVVRVDGLWVTLMFDTQEKKKDRLGRQRVVKKAKKVPLLVAQGVWPQSERQEVVAWVIGEAENEESWEALLTQMFERGICPERGLRLLVADGAPALLPARKTVYWDVPFQRCVFHKLRNIWRAIVLPEGLEGKAAKAYKRRFIRSAARIWQAATEKEARRLQRKFCKKWEQKQPKAIATLQRDFDDTLTFYRVQQAAAECGERWPAHCLRTTSHLEREFRAWRRRLRGAVLFHSSRGLTAVVHQILVRRMCTRDGSPPGTWQLSLERALADSEPFS